MPQPVDANAADPSTPRAVAADTGVRGPDDNRPPAGPAAPAAATGPGTRPVPSFLRPAPATPRVSRRARRLTWAGVAMLALLLVFQLLLADRERLAADAAWRPLLARLCSAAGCTLPPWHEPSAFTMLSRDVRPHPDIPGTLRVTATFRNDARWAQPWPTLLLTLSDLEGRMAGARAFAAADYVAPAQAQGLLAPGQTATVTLDVVEPAPRIVAFTFDFR